VLVAKQTAEILCINDQIVCDDFRARGYVLFSEVFAGGYGNSPTEALAADLAGKRVIHKSANFSNGLFAHPTRDGGAMFAASFVNLSAVAAAARDRGGPVLIVAAGSFADRRPSVEDDACAELLAKAICEPGVELRSAFAQRAEAVRHDLASKPRRLDTGPGGRYRLDVEYALQLDVSSAVPRLSRRDRASFVAEPVHQGR
jgi:phosphosulfolactate phosphohydrolase-like enzyme